MPVTLFMEDVTVLDYAYFDAATGARGDTLVVDVELGGELDANGFVFDFGKAKRAIKGAIDRDIDHRAVVPRRAAGLVIEQTRDRVHVRYGGVDYSAPDSALAFIDAVTITRESIAAHIEHLVRPHMPANVRTIDVHLHPDARAQLAPSFCYTHGLRAHDGNCQRLLHGHCGTFHTTWDGKADTELAQWLARRFDGAHFAAQRDVRGSLVAYVAEQGAFDLVMPHGRVVAIDAEPSIENLTRIAFETVVNERHLDGNRLVVSAYEGSRKGACFSVLQA